MYATMAKVTPYVLCTSQSCLYTLLMYVHHFKDTGTTGTCTCNCERAVFSLRVSQHIITNL